MCIERYNLEQSIFYMLQESVVSLSKAKELLGFETLCQTRNWFRDCCVDKIKEYL